MKKGFTLIELLIVVAIIAILAAIAVPNFLEAQTRAKISRGLADMRSVVTALEVYKIDTNSYPSDSGHSPGAGYTRFYTPNNVPPAQYTFGYELTTPIAYLSSINGIKDPFRLQKKYTGATFGRESYAFINYEYRGKLTPGSWTQRALLPHYGPYVMSAAGPDSAIVNDKLGGGDYSAAGVFPAAASPNYDATNGTVSVGDIYWSPKFPPGNLKFL